MEPVAQKPNHPPPQMHPVGQHGLRQELSNLVNAGILHFGASECNPSPVAGKSSWRNLTNKLGVWAGGFGPFTRPIPINLNANCDTRRHDTHHRNNSRHGNSPRSNKVHIPTNPMAKD